MSQVPSYRQFYDRALTMDDRYALAREWDAANPDEHPMFAGPMTQIVVQIRKDALPAHEREWVDLLEAHDRDHDWWIETHEWMNEDAAYTDVLPCVRCMLVDECDCPKPFFGARYALKVQLPSYGDDLATLARLYLELHPGAKWYHAPASIVDYVAAEVGAIS